MKPKTPCACCGTLSITGPCIGSMSYMAGHFSMHIIGYICGGPAKGKDCDNIRWIAVPPIEPMELRKAGAA